MGDIDDSEPPAKRPEVGSGDAEKSQDELDREMIGPKGIIKKQEFVKLIISELKSLGYDQTWEILQVESGIQLHSSAVNLFVQQVRNKNWDKSLETLRTFGLDEAIVKSAQLLILEHKFLELLTEGNVKDALATLRNEIKPLSVNIEKVHELAACFFSSSQHIVPGLSGQDDGKQALHKLEKVLPAEVLVPERRLITLVEQAVNAQRDACLLHNTSNELSLYSDHLCGREQIPSHTLQVLEHKDEVWFLKFSHNGNFLASASKDRLVVIWEVKENGTFLPKHELNGHEEPVVMISWCSDDSRLLSCGQKEVIRLWDVISGHCQVFKNAGVGMISCGWRPDKKGFYGVKDKYICSWTFEPPSLLCYEAQRIFNTSDMAIPHDGKIIMNVFTTEIHSFDLEQEELGAWGWKLFEEEQEITSFSLSEDNKFLLINLANQEIHLWSIDGHPTIVSKYKGHKHRRFIIRSCFGGFDQAFIASGSEDSQVYIWHRRTAELLSVLPGHTGSVNCVSWNPKNPHMLASASDDHTIRIWGTDDLKRKATPDSDTAQCSQHTENT